MTANTKTKILIPQTEKMIVNTEEFKSIQQDRLRYTVSQQFWLLTMSRDNTISR